MLAYAIWLIAVLHAVNAVRAYKGGPVVIGAVALALAVTLQAALGIATLLLVVPLSLALSHQAMAMIVLTVATVHAASVAKRPATAAVSSSATADDPGHSANIGIAHSRN
jgi:cytochrome c oxidase assembly protein subunit 15